MAKKALVLGGGGAKGSYQMGVWKAFRELDLKFDIIVGTSIGALNGAMMTQDDFETADQLWNTIEYEKIFGEQRTEDIRRINSAVDMVRFAINEKVMVGNIDSKPLESLIKGAINEQKIRSSPSKFGLVAVELPLLKPLTPMIDEIPKGKLYQYLMASSACFPVFSPYDIDGVKYIDGGYYDNVPINFALQQGAEEIIAVDLEGVGFLQPLKNVGNIPITRINSHWDLGAVFDFDQSLFVRNRRLGYYETMKAFNCKEGHYYTFQNGESLRNMKSMGEKAQQLMDETEALLKRPMARTISAVERDGEMDVLSRINRREYPQQLFCAIAETAGVVYGISPDRVYTFAEFNNLLINAYLSKREQIDAAKELVISEDARQIIANILEVKDTRLMSAALTKLINNHKWSEASRLLSSLLPKEYIAAKYVSLLVGTD